MKKTNNITELVFILDRSGSMGGLESDTIGGFNAMIEKQKHEDGKAFVSTVLFDHETEVLHDRIPIESVDPMTDKDYTVRGCTALLDAIGKSIRHTMFVITTDGMENASREYSGAQIKKLIEKQKKRFGWDFLFIGANIDAIATAKSFGINEDRAVNYHADKRGTDVVYCAMSEAVSNVRCGRKLEKNWSQKINDDYNSRK